MAELPTGTLTFVFTDIEGSTRLLQWLGAEDYSALLGQHHNVMRTVIAAHGGIELSTEGDAFFIVFVRAAGAVEMALDAQTSLHAQSWPGGSTVRVRIGLNTGEARLGGDFYVGLAVHQAARISSAAHGGQVVASAATREVASDLGGGMSWRALGRHRLKDIESPVELFQLCHPDLESELPPLRTEERILSTIPIQLSSFLGREDELQLGAKLLAATRLLSLVGPGGTGKTRLAYRLAGDLAEQFPDAVCAAELAHTPAPALVPASLLASLGLRDEPGRSATDTITGFLRRRRALVVLDNCEHVISAAASLALSILSACPNVKVLSTSREPLRLPGESVWVIPPLALPAPHDGDLPLEILAATDAIALFRERATESRLGFVLDEANAGAILAICRRVEGIPLAIELAAARVRTTSVAQIAERIGQSLDVLSKGSRGMTDRQTSLRATIAWSHALLSDNERALFRRLAVFAGGFTMDAAESVCAGDTFGDRNLDTADVFEVLADLVDKSLVTLVPQEAGEDRYRLLETIRSYAGECLSAADEEQMVLSRHSGFYSALARHAADRSHDHESLDRLETDLNNLLGAVETLAGGDSARHGQLVWDLSVFWDVHGHWRVARRELVRYLSRPDKDRGLEGECSHMLGVMAFNLGDKPEAAVQYERAIGVARELGNRRLEGECLRDLGVLAAEAGKLDEARDSYEKALAIARDIENRVLEGRVLLGLGNLTSGTGDFATARRQMLEALKIAKEIGHSRLENACLGNLGVIAIWLEDFQEAKDAFSQALTIARRAGDGRYAASWLAGLGTVAVQSGDLREARAFYEEALRSTRELGNRRLEGRCLGNLGEVDLHLGDYGEARAHFEMAADIAREVGDPRFESWWLGNLGRVALESGDYDKARGHLATALQLAREIDEHRYESQWATALATVAIEQHEHAKACGWLQRALEIGREIGPIGGPVLDTCSSLAAEAGEFEEAALLLAAAEVHGHRSRAVWETARHDSTRTTCEGHLEASTFRAATQRGESLDWQSAVDTGSLVLRSLG